MVHVVRAIPSFALKVLDRLIALFHLVPGLTRADIEEGCDFTDRFEEVFGREDGDWKSGSIYLFVIDDEKKLLFNGNDPSVENMVLVAEDAGGRDVADEIIMEVENADEEGVFVNYCWDDPVIEEDDEPNSDPMTAPGDSWKKSYVVDPFVYLGAPVLSPSPRVFFGSGIYPKTGEPPSGCKIYGDMDDMEEIEEVVEDVADSISGGGCAIAAGSDSAPRNDALNLLLIASALFFTVSFRRRAMDKQNGVRS